jgi:hypothetical protein
VEAAVEAMREAKWSPRVLQRRLQLFDLRVRGIPMDQIAKQLGPDPRSGKQVTERQLWYDWREIRLVVGAASAPQLEEVCARAEARLERLYTITMVEIAKHMERNAFPDKLVSEARRIIRDLCVLRGAIRPYSVVVSTGAPSHESVDLGRRSEEELRAIARKERDALAELIGENGVHA